MKEPTFKTNKDSVVELLREAIVFAEYKPGDCPVQDKIAKQLNISATPVREALCQLKTEGVLEHSLHRGVRETHLIRDANERVATHEAMTQLDGADIAHLKAL
ncbi:MAG: GntR family transcriptional regulator [Anaerolineales bacterium]|jgi:DNA-binding GntR family transcriptional regulator|nr:GntR family transcriptional regulator [Anaerolineales bacterium]|tara:strand:+ start:3434 stop:3742 length:309 start_codon:yes stop_codon:yes gene_type:complete